MEFRNLKKQYQVLKQDIDRDIAEVCQNANFISGAPVQELEKSLASYVGVKHCISCANGTDALTLALMAMNIGAGDAVFVPDFTFFASAETIAHVGATPIFVDVDSTTFNISSEKLESAVRKTKDEGKLLPKAVISVDLFGLPADYTRLREIADKHGIKIVEDGAQGFGGRLKGKRACSFGDISTTSFFPAKPLGCYGDGGAVFTDNDEWAERIRSLAVHGKDGADKYNNKRIGLNSRLDTIQAVVLKNKLKAFEDYELKAMLRFFGKQLPSFKCENTDDIYNAMCTVMTNTEQCKKMVRDSLDWIKQYHSNERIVELLEHAFSCCDF